MEEPVRDEVRTLLAALSKATGDATLSDLEERAVARVAPMPDLARWAGSGAMALTGPADGPPTAPAAPAASRIAAAGAVLAELAATRGHDIDLDAPALLGERAALRNLDGGGLSRQGTVSAGGGCRLLSTHDGWVAVSLNRPDDWELLPALFGTEARDWADVEAAAAGTGAAELSGRAGDLGLAVGVLPAGAEPADEQYVARGHPWVITTGDGPAPQSLRVVDLSALWAGPLCASLLHGAGAEVTTVESTSRPDGARRGDPHLHRLLHAGHTMRALDLRSRDGLDELHRLVAAADVVVTAARPRALEQLGLDPFAWLGRRAGLTWVAITAYGWTGPWRNRVGYGDDAAVAGGLVAAGPAPMFCADAIADPLTGVYAAVAALAVAASGGGVVDVALRDVAAHVARPPLAPQPPTATRSGESWLVEVDGTQVPVRPPRTRAVP